jgi:uncharacterized protein (TIGR02145 family)
MPKRITKAFSLAILFLMLTVFCSFAQQEIPDKIKDKIVAGINALEMSKVPEDMYKAVSIFSEAAAITPEYPDVHYYLGKTLSMVQGFGHAEKAVNELQKYLELYPEAPDKEKVKDEISQLEEVIKLNNFSSLMGYSLIKLSDGIYVRQVNPNFPLVGIGSGPTRLGGNMTRVPISAGDKIAKINNVDIKDFSIPAVMKLINEDSASNKYYVTIMRGNSLSPAYQFSKGEKKYSSVINDLAGENLSSLISRTKTPLIVFFVSDWCKLCNDYFECHTYTCPTAKYKDSISFVYANVNEYTYIPKEYGVVQTPSVFLFKDGKLFDKIDSYDPGLFDKKVEVLMASRKSAFVGAAALSAGSKVENLGPPVTGTFTDSRDGKTYKTIKIGTQTWMAENLAYKASSGCWAYDNKVKNVAEYGYLYNWETAKTVCPPGWHLPGNSEWSALINYLGGEKTSGSKLKEAGSMHWRSPNAEATNESGFRAFPGGQCYTDYKDGKLKFLYMGNSGFWWSASEAQVTFATIWTMFYNAGTFYKYLYPKPYGFSVRYVMD